MDYSDRSIYPHSTVQMLSFMCTFNTGFSSSRPFQRVLEQYKSIKLKVSAGKESLKGHFNLFIKVKRKNRGSEIDMPAWLQSRFGLSLHCAAEMSEPCLLYILIIDYFTSQKFISQCSHAVALIHCSKWWRDCLTHLKYNEDVACPSCIGYARTRHVTQSGVFDGALLLQLRLGF